MPAKDHRYAALLESRYKVIKEQLSLIEVQCIFEIIDDNGNVKSIDHCPERSAQTYTYERPLVDLILALAAANHRIDPIGISLASDLRELYQPWRSEDTRLNSSH